MNGRMVIILVLGASVVLHAYFALPRLLAKRGTSSAPGLPGDVDAASLPANRIPLAPVQLWAEAPAGEREYWLARKSAQFLIVHGQAMAGKLHVPHGKIRGYLNAKVQNGEIDYVVVLPIRNTKWGDIFPVLDECRKSRVQIVVLKPFES